MKTLIYFLITGTLLFSSYGCAHAQSDDANKQAIQMLTEFYTAYGSVFGFTPDDNKRFYLLIAKYCTPKLRKEAKEDHDSEYGTDDLTHDYGISTPALKTLNIVEDTKKPNTYIVSYFENEVLPSGEHVNEKIILSVTVVNVNGIFKIANVASLMKD